MISCGISEGSMDSLQPMDFFTLETKNLSSVRGNPQIRFSTAVCDDYIQHIGILICNLLSKDGNKKIHLKWLEPSASFKLHNLYFSLEKYYYVHKYYQSNKNV